MKSKAMVILSGGQDSTTCLFWAKEAYDEVHAVTFDYGQRHQRELNAAAEVARMAAVASHTMIGIPNILQSRSPLVDPSEALETYSDFESMDKVIGNRIEHTFVPMRNALFLTIGANIALAKDCFTLVTGVCEEDNANYPDCRRSFIDAQELAINNALGISHFHIVTPLMRLSKAETVMLAATMPDCMKALAYSHTCYAGEYPPCGKCHACVLRAHGFEEAGVPDPLVQRASMEEL